MKKTNQAKDKSAQLLAVSAAAVVLTLAGIVTYSVAANVLPTNPFYSLKTAWQDARVALTFDPAAKSQLSLQLARARINEARTLNNSPGNPAAQTAVVPTLSRAQSALDLALIESNKIGDSAQREKIHSEISGEAESAKQEAEKHAEKPDAPESEKKDAKEVSDKLDKTRQEAAKTTD